MSGLYIAAFSAGAAFGAAGIRALPRTPLRVAKHASCETTVTRVADAETHYEDMYGAALGAAGIYARDESPPRVATHQIDVSCGTTVSNVADAETHYEDLCGALDESMLDPETRLARSNSRLKHIIDYVIPTVASIKTLQHSTTTTYRAALEQALKLFLNQKRMPRGLKNMSLVLDALNSIKKQNDDFIHAMRHTYPTNEAECKITQFIFILRHKIADAIALST
jgi:hypothetical protein